MILDHDYAAGTTAEPQPGTSSATVPDPEPQPGTSSATVPDPEPQPRTSSATVHDFVKFGEAICSQFQNRADRKKTAAHTDLIRQFSLTMYGHSPVAYKFLRNCLGKSLPSRSTLQRYYSKVDCSPGMTANSLAMLSQKVEQMKSNSKELLISLSFDDMSIKKNQFLHGKSLEGNITIGEGSGYTAATHAMVLMATAINDSFKVPVGLFFINAKLPAEERAAILREAICEINRTEAVIVNTVCDNCNTNTKTLKLLGLDYTVDNEVPTLQLQNAMGKLIFAILDTPHLIKIVRNCLGDIRIIFDPDGKRVHWKYIRRLHELQSSKGLFLANKLRKKHIEYHKLKMRTTIAVQTISRSVSSALKYCAGNVNLPKFRGAIPTSEFLLLFDQLFDVLNSKFTAGKYSKAPMRSRNKVYWSKVFRDAEAYIRELRFEDGQKIIESQRKAAFIGFILNMKSFKCIFDQYVEGGFLFYLLTHKFTQDGLENFFGGIRASLGNNDNPTTVAFLAAYKRKIVGSLNYTGCGNCIFDASSDITPMGIQPITGNCLDLISIKIL